MRKILWSFDRVQFDMEDLDVEVAAIHALTGTEISIRFRLDHTQAKGSPKKLRKRIEALATHQLLDFASFLDAPEQ